VNIKIDTANEAIITRGRDFLPFTTDHPIITGNIGNTQGANTVNIQATNDNNNNDMKQEEYK
jgi:hypothetical protein